MFKYHCLNPIAKVGLDQLDENYVNTDNAEEADAILVRSAKMHEMEFAKNLKSHAQEQVSTTFLWTVALRKGSWCSTLREQMQTV